jgi:hypothetical protein
MKIRRKPEQKIVVERVNIDGQSQNIIGSVSVPQSIGSSSKVLVNPQGGGREK